MDGSHTSSKDDQPGYSGKEEIESFPGERPVDSYIAEDDQAEIRRIATSMSVAQPSTSRAEESFRVSGSDEFGPFAEIPPGWMSQNYLAPPPSDASPFGSWMHTYTDGASLDTFATSSSFVHGSYYQCP